MNRIRVTLPWPIIAICRCILNSVAKRRADRKSVSHGCMLNRRMVNWSPATVWAYASDYWLMCIRRGVCIASRKSAIPKCHWTYWCCMWKMDETFSSPFWVNIVLVVLDFRWKHWPACRNPFTNWILRIFYKLYDDSFLLFLFRRYRKYWRIFDQFCHFSGKWFE